MYKQQQTTTGDVKIRTEYKAVHREIGLDSSKLNENFETVYNLQFNR